MVDATELRGDAAARGVRVVELLVGRDRLADRQIDPRGHGAATGGKRGVAARGYEREGRAGVVAVEQRCVDVDLPRPVPVPPRAAHGDVLVRRGGETCAG